MEVNNEHSNSEDSRSEEQNKKNNKDVFNIQSSLNLKKYELSFFHYFESLNKKNDFPKVIEYLYMMIETFQVVSIFYNIDYFPNLPDSIYYPTSVFTFRNMVNQFLYLILGFIASIIASLTGLFFYLSFSYVVLNIMLFQVYFKNQYISSIIMFAGFTYLLYDHYNNQIYYNKKMNCFYSAIWFSMAFSTLIYIFFTITKIKLIYPIFIGLSVIGFIIGWFLNNLFFNWYCNKVFTKIENKYNQQHVISRLKEQLEMENVNDEETQSIETIVTQRKIVKKEKVYNKPYDCAYVSKFIMNNRSINSFYLVNSLFKEGFLIFNAIYIYELDRSHLKSCNDGSGDNNALDFELSQIRNVSIQYHIAALNSLKNLMNALRTLDSPSDIENAMVINDNLTDILSRGENHFKKYVIDFNYSKESLELYILFLRNSMNRGDLAEQYIQMLEENEDTKDEEEVDKTNKYASGYERSEMMSSMNSDMESRKSKLLNFFFVAAESPVIVSQIKSAIRLLSLMAASGINPSLFPFTGTIKKNLEYLDEVYFPVIYTFHSTQSKGFYTINPIYNGVIDDIKDQSFYKAMMKIYRKAQIVVDGLNRTSILTPEYLHEKNIRFFASNSKGQFGQLFMDSLDTTNENISDTVKQHELMFYVIMGIVAIFMTFTILKIIKPYTDKSYNFVKEIISIYKTLPSKYFNDQSNDYMDQIQEMCENYDVEDEGLFKKELKRKHNSSKKLKYLFISYCLLVSLFLLLPFMTVFKLENDLKNGKYGGKSSSQYDIFESLNHNPGCVRGAIVISTCEERMFSDLYTKELSESPIDYLMVEYLNKLNEFINNAPSCKYNIMNQSETLLANSEIRESIYISILMALSYDITGHIDQMNSLGTQYLLDEAKKYIKITLLIHGVSSFLIFVTFFIFISRPIKRQLRVMDSLTNITFSIPSSIYNSSPKVKNFLENGKLE
ncbi:hypothetical protein H8356DRAFT_953183 [Neocallimastix lanati (nom. inval.)]|nr:hypothetical protein H8356DRAFT_953183 [Neocallimastix sp. JGI-2020a]